MLREELLKKLNTVAPALSSNDLLPVLKHVWFTGDEMLAYNDTIGISVPFKSEFQGAVPGDLLIKMLNNSIAKNIDFIAKDQTFEVKAKNASFKLPTMETPELFTMPEPVGKPFPVERGQFFAALDVCLMSIGQDTSLPDQLGVTMIVGKGSMDMFSTNNSTLSRATIPLGKGEVPFNRVILPSAFCNQMIKLAGRKKELHLEIMDDHALLDAGKGVRMFGRLIESDNPLEFQAIVKQHIPKGAADQFVRVPGKLELILERSVIIVGEGADQGILTITVKESTDPKAQYRLMRFDSKSNHNGEAHDSAQVSLEHPLIKVRLEPRLLKTGLAKYKDQKMLITEQCAIFARGNDNEQMFLVASRATE